MLSLLFFAATVLSLLSFVFPSPLAHSFHPRTSRAPRIMTYYADWAPPDSMDYSLFDTLIFAFALPDQDYRLVWDTDQAPPLLKDMVQNAHAHSKYAVLSVGGWTGSKHFSDAVATPQNRDIFADSIVEVYKRYDLDGIDIDWEYPGQIGQQGNTESPADSANMLQFFKVLRQKLPQGATISAAVQDAPFAGPDGQPMNDVSAFSDFLDWITLMNYDANGIRQPPGPNAPLSDACSNSSQPTQNAVAALNEWTAARFPASKIFLGVPSYGYLVQSDSRRLSTRAPSRAYSEDDSGQIHFKSLLSQGILEQKPDGSYVGAKGFTRSWDSCSSTPFLYSGSAGQVIPYDDDRSLAMKAAWVRSVGMAGVNLFDVHGDTSNHVLTRAMRDKLAPQSPTQSALHSSPLPPSSAVALSSNTILSTAAKPPASSTPHPSADLLPAFLPGASLLSGRS